MSSHSLFSISSALLGLPPEMRSEVTTNLTSLSDELFDKYNLTLRDDSRLGWSFVTKSLSSEWTRQKVMDELCLMFYLHNYTDYESQFKHIIPTIKQNLESELFSTLPKASFYSFEYVRKFVIPLYRIRSILNTCPTQEFPTIWPWLSTTPNEEGDTTSFSEPSNEFEDDEDEEEYDEEDEQEDYD
jgi:hypothetical protein